MVQGVLGSRAHNTTVRCVLVFEGGGRVFSCLFCSRSFFLFFFCSLQPFVVFLVSSFSPPFSRFPLANDFFFFVLFMWSTYFSILHTLGNLRSAVAIGLYFTQYVFCLCNCSPCIVQGMIGCDRAWIPRRAVYVPQLVSIVSTCASSIRRRRCYPVTLDGKLEASPVGRTLDIEISSRTDR